MLVPDNYFTHSIDNFSIFTFVRPADAVRESHRTLRPDMPLMPTPRPEFYEEGVLRKVVGECGFATDTVTMVDKVLIVNDDENVAGLTMLMSGPMVIKAREGFTEEEEARWGESVGQFVEEEIEQFGGIRFEAYILLATK